MTTLSQESIEQMKAGFRGELLLPEDSGYDEARTVWNSMFDRKPAIIARCIGNSDVLLAVNFARENNMLLAVKGGGHSVAGKSVCDAGMMIDLSLMRSVTVDPEAKKVRVDGGALLGDVDAETQLHGLAVPAGIVSHTGVGGLTLGGGFGWISRKHGLSVDNLLSATVVTAEGRVVTANENENADLFWALRGGGGNFGVVTSFEFKCVQIGTEVFSGVIVKNFDNSREVMQFYRDYVKSLPDEMTMWLLLRKAPPLPFLPEDVHGKLVVLMPFVYLGDVSSGEKLINPVLERGETHGELVGMHPWRMWQSMFDALLAHGARNYWKSHHLAKLPDESINTILEATKTWPSDECDVDILNINSANATADEDSAYAHRTAPYVFAIHMRWRDPGDDERCISWSKNLADAMQKHASGVYVNYLSEEGEARVKDAYSPEVWNRLVEVKKKWDPQNLFSMNQNIKPTA